MKILVVEDGFAVDQALDGEQYDLIVLVEVNPNNPWRGL